MYQSAEARPGPSQVSKINVFVRIVNPLFHNVKMCSHRKIFKVCLAIFEHYEIKGQRLHINVANYFRQKYFYL